MSAPVTGLIQQTNSLDWVGNRYNIYMTFVWTENETGPCHYDVDVHQITLGGWQNVGSVAKGVGFLMFQVGSHGPSDNWQYHQYYDQVRVTCVPDVGTPASTTTTIVWHTTRLKANLTNHTLHNGGMQGNQLFMYISGIDPSYYIYTGGLKVYNMTQNTKLIFHCGYGDLPKFALDFCNHSQIAIGFLLDPDNIPNQGDSIQCHYECVVGNGKNPSNLTVENDGIITIFGATYSGPVNFPFLSLSATQGNAFSYFVSLAPGITGDPFAATYSRTSGTLPPGLTMDSTGLITGTPTVLGTFNFHVHTVSSMGDPGGGDVQIVVSASTLPIITGPFTSVSLFQFAAMSFQLVCTNNPSSFVVSSGSLPTGLSLNTTTGVVSGTPTVLQGSLPVGFKATNVIGQGPEFIIQIAVVVLPPPAITSPSTATAYRGETWNYLITASNAPIAFAATNLPVATLVNTQTGLISGVIDPTLNLPGTQIIVLRAQNHTGYSPNFNLILTIADRLPVINSDLTVTANAFEEFTYQISATGFPVTFGAAGLPFGLIVDPNSGLITGTPITPGTYNITITATNSAGTGTAVLVLIVRLLRPIIDTSITSGKAITCETGIPIEFQPVATNNPTTWSCKPVPVGFTVDGRVPNVNRAVINAPLGLLAGTFDTVGLYGTVFEAFNQAGGSDPAIFYFLVEAGAGGVATNIGTGMDIWIDIQTGEVTLLAPGQTLDQTVVTTKDGTTTTTVSKVPVPLSDAVITNKRGDTLPVTIWFHKNGRPVQIADLTSLIFGVREDYTSPYAVLATGYHDNLDGSYTIWPNYSGNAEIDFEIDDEEEFIELLAEVQWETGTQDPQDPRDFTRRSSQTFKNQIYRDVIHPDDPS